MPKSILSRLTASCHQLLPSISFVKDRSITCCSGGRASLIIRLRQFSSSIEYRVKEYLRRRRRSSKPSICIESWQLFASCSEIAHDGIWLAMPCLHNRRRHLYQDASGRVFSPKRADAAYLGICLPIPASHEANWFCERLCRFPPELDFGICHCDWSYAKGACPFEGEVRYGIVLDVSSV